MIEQNFISKDDCHELAAAMNTKYRLARGEREFAIKARLDGEVSQVEVCLKHPDKSFVYPVEARVRWENEELTPYESATFLIDYIDNYFEEFLLEEDERLYLPIQWADHDYEAVKFEIRGQILNKKVENMADEFLREHGYGDMLADN